MLNKKIGFIGQGWIGKNYADDFERRGYEVVRYSLEEPHVNNGDKIAACDIVFIAVPTPTTAAGFDDSIVRAAVKKAGPGKTAVIKSTILPGTTESIQADYPGIFVMHSPEFLTEARAAYDAAHPNRNIVGIPVDDDNYRAKAQAVLDVLPSAPFSLICRASEAELLKYGGNCWFYFKVIYVNLLYDFAQKLGCRWEVIRDSLAADPRIGPTHLNPVHESGATDPGAGGLKLNDYHLEPVHKSGRGAGGHCFIKDFAAFREKYAEAVGDEAGLAVLDALAKKNIELLVSSNKDLELLKGVYGDNIASSHNS